MAQNESNNMLYLVTGGLLVAFVVVAIAVWGNPEAGPEGISPAAGSSSTVIEENTTSRDRENGNETTTSTTRETQTNQETTE